MLSNEYLPIFIIHHACSKHFANISFSLEIVQCLYILYIFDAVISIGALWKLRL